MKVIVAGSRDVIDYLIVEEAIRSSPFANDITEVVSGTARGVDRLGENYAKFNNIPIKRFPANWDKYGKRAGYLRNAEMAHYSDALVAVWDGVSPGTKHMIDLATKEGIEVFIYNTKESN
jgi:hypothetical protein